MAKQTSTIADQVYQAIRVNIMTLKIAPGTAMSEKEIGEKLNVSRTPVREAFIRLEKEGLVRIYPQKGTNVSQLSISRAKEERFMRESLETAVLHVFIREHSEEAIARLERNIRKQKEAEAAKEWDRFMEYDDQFHDIFYQETNKLLCGEVVKNSNVDYYRLRCLSVLVSGGIAALNLEQHTELLEYIKANDEDGAQQILRKHLRKVFMELDEMQEKYPQYFKDSTAPNMEMLMNNMILK